MKGFAGIEQWIGIKWVDRFEASWCRVKKSCAVETCDVCIRNINRQLTAGLLVIVILLAILWNDNLKLLKMLSL